MAHDITAELKSFVTAPENSFVKTYEKTGIVRNAIPRFLDARMDQVRIYHALRASRALLETVSAGGAFAFQEAVLTKERSKEIAYHSQRDHTCHTLNNFILGWYIYENSALLQKSFSEVFEKRQFGIGKSDHIRFAAVWIYVSLLHDIGYIFEGDFSKPAAFKKHEGIKTAIKCLKDHFDREFWTSNLISEKDKKALIKKGVIDKFDISVSSIDELSDSLQRITDLTSPLGQVKEVYSKPPRNTRNAFDLWSENYRFFANEKMRKKIDKLKLDFEQLRKQGLKKGGPKILNHGVCSGLILLRFVTYYYALYYAMKSLTNDKQFSKLTRRYEKKAGLFN